MDIEPISNGLKIIEYVYISEDLSNTDINLDTENHRYIFKNVNMSNSRIRLSDFSTCYFENCNLEGSNIDGCSFRNATIKACNFNRITMKNTYFEGAMLQNVYMENSDLYYVDFYRCFLEGVSFKDSKMENVSLKDACIHMVEGLPEMVCPKEGSFIGWKKVYDWKKFYHDGSEYIVKLEIPEDAKRSSALSNKCRCEKAKVLEILNVQGEKINKFEVTNLNLCNFRSTEYKVGEMVYPDSFDDNRWNECSHGIHFFMTKEEAMEYKL